MVLEVDLHYFVAEPEHDGMASTHPLLDVDGASRWLHALLHLILHIHLCMLMTGTLLG